MYHLLYETTNTINGKKYRGIHSTTNYDDGYLGSGDAIRKAIKKYGKESFTREVLIEATSRHELIELEKQYVNSEWVSRIDTYNAVRGGQRSDMTPEETKKKISATLKGKPRQPRSEETKRRISEKMKGRVSPMTGMKHSEATKEKMRMKALETRSERIAVLRGLVAEENRAKYYANRRAMA